MGSPPRLSLRHALALGLAHGPTELLPISSSAHTILIPWLAGWPYAELDPELRKSFEVALHAGTAAALLIDLRAVESHPASAPCSTGSWRIAWPRPSCRATGGCAHRLSRAPGSARRALVHSTGRRRLHVRAASATSPQRTPHDRRRAAARRGGDGARRLPPPGRTRTLQEARALDGLLLGLAQTFALVPGVSRSGAVLSAARARGFSRVDSHTLARRTGLPVILGAGALKTGRLLQRAVTDGGTDQGSGGALLLGGAASLLSTLAATRLLRRARRTAPAAALWPYSLYRGLLASLVVVLHRSRGPNHERLARSM